MKFRGITFLHALTLGPLCDDGRVEFTIEPASPRGIVPGVYLVTDGDRIVYIGSYRNGVIRRWVYVRKRDLYHFKKPLVVERLKAGATLKVFAEDEVAIKTELQCQMNPWVNANGIESRLIALQRPPWNNHGKK